MFLNTNNFLSIKIEKNRINVTIRWLVVVKLSEINLIKLLNKRKDNKDERKLFYNTELKDRKL